MTIAADPPKHTAGPAGDHIPDRLRAHTPVTHDMLDDPRGVVLDRPAQRDYAHLPSDIRKRVDAVLDAVKHGAAAFEAKVRALQGVFTVKVTRSWRAAFYLGAEGAWHLFSISDHNYDEVTRRWAAIQIRAAAKQVPGLTFATMAPHEGPVQRVDNRGPNIKALVDGAYVGHIYWDADTGEVTDIYVVDDHRREGIATALWEEAKRRDPKVRHSETQTPDGKAWSQKTASQPVEYYHLARGMDFIAARSGGKTIGLLSIGRGNHEVQSLWVAPEFRRQGIATQMWEHGKQVRPGLIHSLDRTDAGDAWARAVGGEQHGGPVGERRYNTTTTDDGEKHARMIDRLFADLEDPVWGARMQRQITRLAFPSWRDRGERPEADVLIVPDTGRARRNSYSVYLHGQPHARRGSLAEAKQVVEAEHGPLVWTKVAGDQMPHYDRTWGHTVAFNDAPYYLVASLPKKTAAADLPEEIVIEVYRPGAVSAHVPYRPGAFPTRLVGTLEWWTDTGEIKYVQVNPEFQRRGIATAMLAKAREADPRVHHSETLTEDGQGWSQHTASLDTAAALIREAIPFLHLVTDQPIDTKPMTGFEDKASYQWIHPQIATGGAIRYATDLRQLQRKGVTAIVSGRRDFDDALLAEGRDLGIRFLSNPTPDNGDAKPTSWFKAAIDFCLPVLRSGQRVYVHCHAGMNRGPSMAYAVLRAYTGCSHEQAMHAIQSVREYAPIAYAGDADKALVELGYAKATSDVHVTPFHTLTGSLLTKTANPTPASLPNVGPVADDYWGAGGCGKFAVAFTELVPGLKIAVEWGTGQDEGLVWHATAYDPATKRSFDFNGTDHVNSVLGNFGGKVEMDVSPPRVAEAMRFRYSPDEPWEDEGVYEASEVITDHWHLSWTGATKTSAYDDTKIARGLKLTVDNSSLAKKFIEHTVTANDIVRALMAVGGLGDWWGVMGSFGDLVDFEDYAWGEDSEALTTTWHEYTTDPESRNHYGWIGGEVQIVLIAKRPTRDGQPWDPEIHNEGNGLMGNSYLQRGEQVDLVEIRYNPGDGWHSLPATGIRATAAMTGPLYRGMVVTLDEDQQRLRAEGKWVDLANSIAPQITAKGASHSWYAADMPSSLGVHWTHSLEVAKHFTANPRVPRYMAVVVEARYDDTVPEGRSRGKGMNTGNIPGGEQERVLEIGTPVEIDYLWLRTVNEGPDWAKVSMNGLRAEAAGAEQTWYHGCSLRRAEEVSRIGFGADYRPTVGNYGIGLYLSNNPATANNYGDMVTRNQGRPGGMVTLHATPSKVFEVKSVDLQQRLSELAGSTKIRESAEISDLLKHHGYDALLVHFQREDWLVLFDPTDAQYRGYIPSVPRKEYDGRVATLTREAAVYDDSRARELYGKGYEAWERTGTTMPFPGGPVYRNNPREKYKWDNAALGEALASPHFENFDPRTLRASQGGITPAGVRYYMGDRYARSGETYADGQQAGNQYPVVYVYPDGTHQILSGHHRAVAALLKGELLRAIRVDHPEDPALPGHAHALRGAGAGRRDPGGDRQAGGLGDRVRGHRGAARGGVEGRGEGGRQGHLVAQAGAPEGGAGQDRAARLIKAALGDLDDPTVEHWRPTGGMFAPGMDTLDPRIFDTATNQMLPQVQATIMGTLGAFWTPRYGDWQDWARVYLAGSGASYWWDSDADMDILIGVDLDRLRAARPANREVSDEDIVAHLNRELTTDLRPTTTHMLGFEATWFINPGAYDIAAIHPYAAYDVGANRWVQHPPRLPKDWGPSSIPDETWRRCEMAAREAEEVLSLPEPQRTTAGTVLFNWIHEGRRAAYSANGGGWLDPGNVIYQFLGLHPAKYLRRLYLCKHPEAATAAEGLEKTAGKKWYQPKPGATYFHVSPKAFQPGEMLVPGSELGVHNFDGDTTNNYVFLSKDLASSETWARIIGPINWEDTFIYEVEPVGKVKDTDTDESVTKSARVRRKVKTLKAPPFEPYVSQWTHQFTASRGSKTAEFEESEHPRADDGKFTRKGPNMDRDAQDKFLRDQFGPSVKDTATMKHPKSGYNLPIGKEYRVAQPKEGEGPAVFRVKDYGKDLDDPKQRWGMGTDAGTEPIQHVYRGMSRAEYEQAMKRGYFGSDKRGVLADWEGTNAAVDPQTAAYYLATNHDSADGGYLVQFKVHPDRKWFTIPHDDYVRTRENIPLEDVEKAVPLGNDGRALYPVTGRVAKTSAVVGTFWRVHPEGREFGPWDASSHPFYVDEPRTPGMHPLEVPPSREWRAGDPTVPGYSCFESPWHLYLYVCIQWASISDSTSVLRFAGERVGTGTDGEDLAVPTALPFRTTWGAFKAMLPQYPLPASPVFAPWVAGRKEYGSWKALAQHWKWLDDEDPVHEFVVQRVLRSRSASLAEIPAKMEPVTAKDKTAATYIDATPPKPEKWEGTGIYEMDLSGVSTTGCVALLAEAMGMVWPIAWLSWDKTKHTVEGVWVEDNNRGKGIGAGLLEEAEKVAGTKLVDSGEYTPEGFAWAKKRGLNPKLKTRTPANEMARMNAQMHEALIGGHRIKRLLEKVG